MNSNAKPMMCLKSRPTSCFIILLSLMILGSVNECMGGGQNASNLMAQSGREGTDNCNVSKDALVQDYDILLKAFFDGKLKEVVESIPDSENKTDGIFNVLKLKARAAGEAYWKYYFTDHDLNGRTPTQEEVSDLSHLAALSTQAYETAFVAAPSIYDRVCLTAEWILLNLQRYYDADSKLLRQATIKTLHEANQPSPCDLELWEKVVERTVLGALARKPKHSQPTKERQNAIAAVFRQEFAYLGIMDIPEPVFLDLVEDLPTFIGFCLPLDNQKEAEAYRKLIRWYLWVAMTVEEPGAIERCVIDAQVETQAKLIEKEFNSMFKHPLMLKLGSKYADRYRVLYADLKDNRFITYFRRALLPYQKQGNAINRGVVLKDIRQNLNKSIRRIENRFKDKDALKSAILKEQAGYSVTLYDALYFSFVRYSRPFVIRQLPDQRISTSSGNRNEFGVYVFGVGKTHPIIPFCDE